MVEHCVAFHFPGNTHARKNVLPDCTVSCFASAKCINVNVNASLLSSSRLLLLEIYHYNLNELLILIYCDSFL